MTTKTSYKVTLKVKNCVGVLARISILLRKFRINVRSMDAAPCHPDKNCHPHENCHPDKNCHLHENCHPDKNRHPHESGDLAIIHFILEPEINNIRTALKKLQNLIPVIEVKSKKL